jgi:hypothetical protein
MTLPWFDPMLFAIICLTTGGVVLTMRLACPVNGRSGAWFVLRSFVVMAALADTAFTIVAAASGQPLALWGSTGTLAALYVLLVIMPSTAFLAGTVAVSAAAARVLRSKVGRRAAILAVWALCPFAALGLIYEQCHYTNEAADEAFFKEHLTEGVATPQLCDYSPLTTDRGHMVNIWTVPGVPEAPTDRMVESQERMLARFDLHGNTIELPQGWQNNNCHGFVFTAGRFWIGGSQVDLILDDNGYQPVSAPSAGDLAIYRDKVGAVMHSGIVRGLASDGVILVESKFGQASRFVHCHDRHPYPDCECTFYRSARSGHLLRGVYPTSPGEITAQPSTEPSTAPTSSTRVGL